MDTSGQTSNITEKHVRLAESPSSFLPYIFLDLMLSGLSNQHKINSKGGYGIGCEHLCLTYQSQIGAEDTHILHKHTLANHKQE